MKRTCFAPRSRATRTSAVVIFVLLALLLVGCDVAGSSGAPIQVVITPVPTPTLTPPPPPTVGPVTYTVKPGDTLSGIAEMFGVSVDDIVRVNNIADPNSLSVGQVLNIPPRVQPGAPTIVVSGTSAVTGTQTGAGATPTLAPVNVTPPQGPPAAEPSAGASPTVAP